MPLEWPDLQLEKLFVCLFVCCLTAQRHARIITVPKKVKGRKIYVYSYIVISLQVYKFKSVKEIKIAVDEINAV